MSNQTAIEWTDATWNPVRGCTRVSEGCRNCYAERMAARFSDPGQWGHGFATATRTPRSYEFRWTNKVDLIKEKLEEPLKWKKPRRIFVNSTSDLFHEGLPLHDIDRVFDRMWACPQHTFQVLTKRPERMLEYFDWKERVGGSVLPYRNVWLGVSVEDQATADERIPLLLKTPAAKRFVSAEPMLGPVELSLHCCGCGYTPADKAHHGDHRLCTSPSAILDWVIVGGESGPGARPMNLDWARSIRDQCKAAGVPFFFKQTGARQGHGSKLLDGVEHREFPER